MAGTVPNVLILGHSFVKRLQRDMISNFDARVDANFKLHGSAIVHLHGIGGRTVTKLRSFDLHAVTSVSPDVVILEIGTNDLSLEPPEVVGSAIQELVQFLLDHFPVRVVGVCHVIPHGISEMSHIPASLFAQRAHILNRYVSVVLEDIPNVFCWCHKTFSHPAKNFFLADGVHLNPFGPISFVSKLSGRHFERLVLSLSYVDLSWAKIFVLFYSVLVRLAQAIEMWLHPLIYYCGFVHCYEDLSL